MTDVASRLAKLSPAQRRLLEARLQKNPQVAQPIAVVGMACRLPGAPSIDAYWDLIANGRSAVQQIPPGRWDAEAYYDEDHDAVGKMATRWCAFIDDVEQFDAMFFGITPREAGRMDPQQRLLLEVAWEALENAGIAPDQLAGSNTGVFVGIGGTDYSKLPTQFVDYLEHIDAHVGTGNALSIAANRVSYILDLRGPSLAVDTACSSAFVGLHMAVQALRNHECDAALASGVNLILSPEVTIAFSKARMLSPTGRCRPFDASADGYVRGEGCGTVVLKRLTEALRDDDNVLAIVRGTAVNQDGRTSGITAPNSLSQQVCIRAALAAGGLQPKDVNYIEAHGTGTPLGDPIEIQSLTKLFPDEPGVPPCYVSSIKSNIGHTETVSGMAGLIKVMLMMKHGVIPPQMGLEELNPNVVLDGTRLRIPTQQVKWASDTPRIAGISSFGFGGTNTHVVVEAATPVEKPTTTIAERPKHVLAISTRSANAMPALANSYRETLEQLDDKDLADFCYSANTGRSHFGQRAALVAESREQMRQQLTALAEDNTCAGLKRGDVRIASKPKIAFLFTGQGSQYHGMGQQLYDDHPVFRESMDRCDEILKDHGDHRLLEVIYDDADETLINQTVYTQPALFAFEYSLAQLWKSWGVEPSVMLGHSVGEYVAACVADVFSLEDGLRLIAKRAELMQQLPTGGMMAVLFATRERVTQELTDLGSNQVAIATANGPENNVISGTAKAVEAVVARFEKLGIGTQRLAVSHAFHSPLMDPMLDEFEAFAKTMTFHRPTVPIVANRTGKVTDDTTFNAGYWRDHIRNAVEFATGMEAIEELGVHAYLEVGPAANLLGMGRRCLSDSEAAWVPSVRKGRGAWDTLLGALSDLYLLGVAIDWRGFDKPWGRSRVALPNYPFQRSRHWMDGKTRGAGAARGPAVHPLLGAYVMTALPSKILEVMVNADSPKYLRDHQVQGSILAPAAFYFEQALAAAAQLFGSGQHGVENVAIQQGLFVPTEGHRVVQSTVGKETSGRASFESLSTADESEESDAAWTLHATASLVHEDLLPADVPGPPIDQQEFESRIVKRETRDGFYGVMDSRNLVYGPAFRVLGDVNRSRDDALSQLQLDEQVKKQLDKYLLHPVIGDALMQLSAGVIPLEENNDYSPFTYVPVMVRQIRVFQPITADMALTAYAKRVTEDTPSPETVESHVYLLDSNGHVVVECQGVVTRRVGRGAAADDDVDARSWLYDIEWEPAAFDEVDLSALSNQRVVVFGDNGKVNAQITAKLQSAGAVVIPATRGESFAVGEVDGIPRYQLRPNNAEDYQQLVEHLYQGNQHIDAVLYTWSLDLSVPSDASACQLAESVEDVLAGFLRIVQQLAKHQTATKPEIYVLTRQAQAVADKIESTVPSQSAMWGMGRVAALEARELRTRLIDLDQAEPKRVADAVAAEIAASADEDQVAYRGGQRHVARLVPAPDRAGGSSGGEEMPIPNEGSYRLRFKNAGSFDALNFENYRAKPPGKGEVSLEIRATGLNFSDVLKALGLYPGITDAIVPLGIECSGVVTAVGEGVDRFEPGDEVMGVVPYSFASHGATAEYALVKKPASIDHAEAATIPITFLTAYYALVRLAQLAPSERVLIQAGAGGVGLAAIQIAQQIGAEVFATAGSDEKREYLRSLGVQHVMNSRTLEFADQIREITSREGIDVVLNSLPGDAIEAGLSVLRAHGRFLEIGKTDIYGNSKIGLLPFQDNLSYFAIDLDRMLRQRPDYIRSLFAEMMEFFADGSYQPLPFTQFAANKTVDAFRYMAQRKNIGKVVVEMEDRVDDIEPATPSSGITENATYLITGGLGALGMRVADWLGEQGATHVALLSRRGPSTEIQQKLERLAEHGLHAAAIQGDVSDIDSLRAAINQLPTDFPPLRGIIHAAGVLADGMMFDMELEQLRKPLVAKIAGTWNLHQLSLDLPLDVFVMFSSVASVLGSPGQSNYAAGNAFLDGMAAYRRSEGLPATSINWGPWADSGMAAEAGRDQQLSGRGMQLLPADEALDMLGHLIRNDSPQTIVASVSWADLLRAMGNNVPPLLRTVAEGVELGSSDDSAEDRALRGELLVMTIDQRKVRLVEFFTGELARIMGMEPADIDTVQPLNTMGMDSLMAIELKNKIERRLQVNLPMSAFLHEPSVSSLAEFLAEDYGKQSPPETSEDSTVEPTMTARGDAPEEGVPAPHSVRVARERSSKS